MEQPPVPKKSSGFQEAFLKRLPIKPGGIKLPAYPISDVEDAYVHYVVILGISEDLFWNADIHVVQEVAKNKRAYEAWHSHALKLEYEKQRQQRR